MAPVEHHKSLHQQEAWNADCVAILTENTEHIKHRKANPSITASFINIDNFPHICCNYDAVFFLHSNFQSVYLRIFELPLNVKAGWWLVPAGQVVLVKDKRSAVIEQIQYSRFW